MEEKKVSTLFEDMRDDVTNYIHSTLELAKLEAFEKASIGFSSVVYCLIIGGITLFALLFIFLTIGFFLGKMLENNVLGFAIVAGFTILFALVMLLLKKMLKTSLSNRVVRFLMDHEEREEKEVKKSNQ